jgi:hypothetical protein
VSVIALVRAVCVCVCVCACVRARDKESEEGVVVQFIALPFTHSSACMYFSPLPEILPLAPRILTVTVYSNTLSMCSDLTKTM